MCDIWIVTYIDLESDDQEPVITVYNNEESALKHQEYLLNTYPSTKYKVIFDKSKLFSSFNVFDKSIEDKFIASLPESEIKFNDIFSKVHIFKIPAGRGRTKILIDETLKMAKRLGEKRDIDSKAYVLAITFPPTINEKIMGLYSSLDLQLKNSDCDMIFKDVGNETIKVKDIYDFINSEKEEGRNIVGLCIYNMRKVLSEERSDDNIDSMLNLIDELNELAKCYNIPVLCGQQSACLAY